MMKLVILALLVAAVAAFNVYRDNYAYNYGYQTAGYAKAPEITYNRGYPRNYFSGCRGHVYNTHFEDCCGGVAVYDRRYQDCCGGRLVVDKPAQCPSHYGYGKKY
ncbi:uncharacterized protein LOC106175057 [Lingula anatina]|uniref:Uncharacterized protein LOC106175057 n=1 Tax=Lingula anatina TaxID=7574 RepID=A0A1S3JPP3_LINAN|nr:uncharacterized protein LOC106175057 [Lingula anatina]|eukprot:XP_013412327.1 uncharacterized protein LOC106175057 [Lingula anatina]